jgi:cell wall-associated NlpC family hydrolase
MNGKKIALGLAVAPILLIVLILTLVLGGGGAVSQAADVKGYVRGVTELNDGAVPAWAVQFLVNAARTCPEITAPILAAQIETESNWDPNAYNAGSGATGLAQFIPSTWASYGADGDGDGKADPRDPADAIKTQAVYMCHLVDFVKNTKGLNGEIVDLALASFNAGPGNVEKFHGIPPFEETTNYVTKIRGLANTKYAKAGSAPTGSGRAAAVIQKAAEHVNKTPYSWGGGTLNGPSGGSSPDVGVVGFDCSSLVRYAFYQGTGQAITLPRVAQAQFDATKSQPIAVKDLQPGDLLFWGAPGNLHHVALYVGNGRMIEAPQSGELIHETNIRTNGDYAGATRVFGGPLDVANKV